MIDDNRIDIIGIGADGLSGLRPELVERIQAAEFLAGGKRQLGYAADSKAERFVIKDNLAQLGDELERRWPSQRCVVLASGDPLFYGIGDLLLKRFGSEALRFEPAVSSLQLAFARAGLTWNHAAVASVHGRPFREMLLPLLGKRLIGVLGHDGGSPAQIAEFFLDHRCRDYTVWVGENLGGPAERVTRWRLEELRQQTFAPLNVVILKRNTLPLVEIPNPDYDFPEERGFQDFAPGIEDSFFERPDSEPAVMTSQEVRAILVTRLPTFMPGDVIWEIGAGLGTVSVEMAIARPHVEIFSLERNPARFAYVRKNLEKFDVYNVRAYQGEAPEALELFPTDRETLPPQMVFVGGSGGRLAEILDACSKALRPGGEFLADFVTLENLALTLEYFRKRHWPHLITEVSIARSSVLGGLTTLNPQRSVFILDATKPRNSDD